MAEAWNRCDVCGRFIALGDFDSGAVRLCVNPNSDRSIEVWDTLCIKHAFEEFGFSSETVPRRNTVSEDQ